MRYNILSFVLIMATGSVYGADTYDLKSTISRDSDLATKTVLDLAKKGDARLFEDDDIQARITDAKNSEINRIDSDHHEKIVGTETVTNDDGIEQSVNVVKVDQLGTRADAPENANAEDFFTLDSNELTQEALVDRDAIQLSHQRSLTGVVAEGATEDDISSEERENARNKGCPLDKNEDLVCTAVLCTPLGFLDKDARPKCIRNQIELMKAKALLGLFKKLPSCKTRDENCQVTGKASNNPATEAFCEGLTGEDRHGCLLGINISNEEGAKAYMTDRNVSEEIADTAPFDPNVLLDDKRADDNSYLATTIDPRYKSRYNYEIGKNPEFDMIDKEEQRKFKSRLISFLRSRDVNDSAKSMLSQQRVKNLIEDGVLSASCLTVPNDAFYNCNYYGDQLPEACWTLNKENEIAMCAGTITRQAALQ